MSNELSPEEETDEEKVSMVLSVELFPEFQ
jgi:hypothetical protein